MNDQKQLPTLVPIQTAFFVERGEYIPRHFHCFHPRTRQTLVKGLFSVLFYLIPPAHASNQIITCNLCHTCMKALLVESFLVLPPAQPMVLVLLSQLSPAHPPQFGDDSPRKNQRMQTGCPSSGITETLGALRKSPNAEPHSFVYFKHRIRSLILCFK